MKSWNDYPPVLNTKQAAELLGVTRMTTISDQCRSGKFPAIKLGKGAWRIDRDRLRMMFASKQQKNRSLADQLGEIELALSTLAAVYHKEPVSQTIREAHAVALAAYNQAKDEQQ